MTWTIQRRAYDHPDAEQLRQAQRTELDARYGNDDHEPGTPPSADDVRIFLIALDACDSPVACGGLRPLPHEVLGENVAEIKRMYATPAVRGTGASVALLRTLERCAIDSGIRRLVLETGTRQPDAIRFYRREGYAPIPPFGDYVGASHSLCFARDLDRQIPRAARASANADPAQTEVSDAEGG